MVSDSINFTADNRSEYSIRIIDGTVKMECYLMGSITGGTGTECNHTIGAVNISEFLDSMNSASLEKLMTAIGKYKQEEWSNLHTQVCEHQTDSFVWSETNWDD
jgi:hypothetical protein